MLNFNNYYDDVDKQALANAGKNGGYSLLIYSLPKIEEDIAFTPEGLEQAIAQANSCEWIFSRLEDRWKEKYYTVAFEPEEHGGGFICPISKGYYKGKYSARWTDCAHCKYNIALPPACHCLAKTGIRTKEDFKRNAQERFDDIEKIRTANESALKLLQKDVRERRQSKIQFYPSVIENQAMERSTQRPTQAELEQAYDTIRKGFNSNSTSWTVDQFNRRWIRCKICGEIKQDNKMASYGGRDGVNCGICALCSRTREGC